MKTIDKFLGKEKKPDPGVEDTRAEAMTLEEMAVKVQERKILGPERKVDMNIIMFVALCLCGLVIINVVLYFLIGETTSNTVKPVPASQDARDMLKERREERAASLASAETPMDASIKQAMEDAPRLEEVESLESIEADAASIDTQFESAGLENTAVEQLEAVENVEFPVENPQAGTSVESLGEPVAEEIREQIQEEAPVVPSPAIKAAQSKPAIPVAEEIPFDTVISVGATINDWAGAWSAQNVDGYLSYYADTFVSEAGMNIEEWRAHRSIRLTKPEWISIGIDKLKINVIDGGAKAEFIQEYNASNYSDKELKKMIFRKVNGEWKIFDERATPVK